MHTEASTVLSQHMGHLFLFCVDLTTHPTLGYTPSSLSGGCSPMLSGKIIQKIHILQKRVWIPHCRDSWVGSGAGGGGDVS